jgi:energy-coupling factor transporter ATP-binding protein EcfA2
MNRVAKVVPPKRVILRDISLSFFPGAKIGVLGLNGSGKSSLLRIMVGVDKEIDGEARPQPGIKIGLLAQEPQLDATKDVRGNVIEGVHVSFFDYDADGYISVTEDYRGLRELDIWPGPAWAFALAINGALGTPTMGYPSLTISIFGIDRGMHGSDTGIYDDAGNFVPQEFERLFDEWDKDGSDGLSAPELVARTIDEADLGDIFGLTASSAEFGLLFVIAAEDGEISRARMRGFYEGTLFYDLAGVPYPG